MHKPLLRIYPLKKHPRLSLVVILLSLLVVLASSKAYAEGVDYPDDTLPTCDFSVCDTSVDLNIGETDANTSASLDVAAYFTSPSGSLLIDNLNLCSNNRDMIGGFMTSGQVITEYRFTNFDNTPTSAPVVYGKYGGFVSGVDCITNTQVINFSGLKLDPATNLYALYIYASLPTGVKNIFNQFSYKLMNNGLFIGLKGSESVPWNVNMRRRPVVPLNKDYIYKFGSDCSILANTTKELRYYDIDNGLPPFDSTQLNGDIVMKLYEKTEGASSFSLIDTWTPAGGRHNITESHTFTAKPGAKYNWVLTNVYYGNVTQVAVPFNGIYSVIDCQIPDPPLPTAATYSPTTSSINYEKGTGGNVTITFSVKLSGNPPCRASGASPIDTITWRGYDGATPIGPPRTINVANCSTTLTNDSVLDSYSISVPSSTLDGLVVGTKPYQTTITIPIATSANSTVANNPSNGGITVYEVPYTRFYGNDIYATQASGDGIFFNTNTNPGKLGGGSAVQYASLAYSSATHNEISTAAFRSAITPPNGVNSLNARWSNSAPDISTYSNYLPDPTDTSLPNNDLSQISLPSADKGAYYAITGNATISGSLPGVSKKITIKATGDIVINSDLVTQNPLSPFDNKTTPVVLLIANNIYINSNVQRVDAILIATNKIYTCASGSSEASPRSSWHTICNKRLVINGAVGAKEIRFARSIGTRLLGETNEDSTVNGNKLNSSAGALNQAAEVINFPAYLYFATPYLKDTSSSGYQSLFNAAPLL